MLDTEHMKQNSKRTRHYGIYVYWYLCPYDEVSEIRSSPLASLPGTREPALPPDEHLLRGAPGIPPGATYVSMTTMEDEEVSPYREAKMDGKSFLAPEDDAPSPTPEELEERRSQNVAALLDGR